MCPPSAFQTTSQEAAHSPLPSDIESLIPNTPLSRAAYTHASSLLHPAILNHSLRVYYYAKVLLDNSSSTNHPTNTILPSTSTSAATGLDLPFTACLFHDIGTADTYNTGPSRFEAEGADAAAKFLDSHGASKEDAQQVWLAIALHTSGGIAERVSDLTRLVRQGVLLDFGGLKVAEVMGEERGGLKEELERKFPRLGAENVLGDLVVRQAVREPRKAPKASWPGGLLRAYLEEPGWEGVNKGF